MICSGRNVATGESVSIEFEETIHALRTVEAAKTGGVCLAPGFVDLQVNGFAGVDFNDPDISISEIGRAIDAILQTGVTRCLPTVITGCPDAMRASLEKLRRAQ